MPTIEESRIRALKRICQERGLPLLPAQDVVKRAVQDCLKPSISFSGGKASLVALHLALQEDPEILVIHNQTGVEQQGTDEYLDKLRDLWGLNLLRIKPDRSFWQIVQTHGWPELRGNSSTAKGRQRARIPRCCIELKEKPFKRWIRQLCIDGNITGLQASESRARFLYFIERGNIAWLRSRGITAYAPLAAWSDEEIWAYIRRHNLPAHPAYSRGYQRTGCWCCTGYKNWRQTLERCDPKLLEFILAKRGEAGLLNYIDLKAEPTGRQDPYSNCSRA